MDGIVCGGGSKWDSNIIPFFSATCFSTDSLSDYLNHQKSEWRRDRVTLSLLIFSLFGVRYSVQKKFFKNNTYFWQVESILLNYKY